MPGIAEALRDTSAPVVAVSPIVGGQAVSGPAAKLLAARGLEVSPARRRPGLPALARHPGPRRERRGPRPGARAVRRPAGRRPTRSCPTPPQRSAWPRSSSRPRGAVRVRVAVVPAKEFAAAKQRLADALPARDPRRAGARDAGGCPRRGRRGAPRPHRGRHPGRGGGRGRGAMGSAGHPGGGGRGTHRRGRARRRALPRVGGDGAPHRPRGPPLPHGRTRCAASSRRAGRRRRPSSSRPGAGSARTRRVWRPPDAVALRFGEPSFADHLAAARARGIEPVVLASRAPVSTSTGPRIWTRFARQGPGRAPPPRSQRPRRRASAARRAARGLRDPRSAGSPARATTSRASRSAAASPRARRSRTATSWC